MQHEGGDAREYLKVVKNIVPSRYLKVEEKYCSIKIFEGGDCSIKIFEGGRKILENCRLFTEIYEGGGL